MFVKLMKKLYVPMASRLSRLEQERPFPMVSQFMAERIRWRYCITQKVLKFLSFLIKNRSVREDHDTCHHRIGAIICMR